VRHNRLRARVKQETTGYEAYSGFAVESAKESERETTGYAPFERASERERGRERRRERGGEREKGRHTLGLMPSVYLPLGRHAASGMLVFRV